MPTWTPARAPSAARARGPSVRLTAEWELPQDFGIGVMGGVYRDRNDDGRRFTGGILAVTFGKQINEKLHGFVEVAGQQLASEKNGGKLVTFDTGLTYLLTETLQVDSALSFGLNRTSPDLGWTVGVSVKF